MAKKVLIPLDDSEFSRKILPHVQRLFDPPDCHLILLHAARAPASTSPQADDAATARPMILGGDFSMPLIDSDSASSARGHVIYSSQVWDDFEVTLRRELEADMRQLQNLAYTVSIAIHFGTPAQEIVRLAKQEQVDVVAMATHGRTGLGRLLMGSVAQEVFRHLNTPLLLVHPGAERADYLPQQSPRRRAEEEV